MFLGGWSVCCCRCGSYARALQYFETYVRDKHGGGLNPSAYNGGCTSYDYDDVSCSAGDVPAPCGVTHIPFIHTCCASAACCVNVLYYSPSVVCPDRAPAVLVRLLAGPSAGLLQVSFLLEVYGQLEEPDGLAGMP